MHNACASAERRSIQDTIMRSGSNQAASSGAGPLEMEDLYSNDEQRSRFLDDFLAVTTGLPSPSRQQMVAQWQQQQVEEQQIKQGVSDSETEESPLTPTIEAKYVLASPETDDLRRVVSDLTSLLPAAGSAKAREKDLSERVEYLTQKLHRTHKKSVRMKNHNDKLKQLLGKQADLLTRQQSESNILSQSVALLEGRLKELQVKAEPSPAKLELSSSLSPLSPSRTATRSPPPGSTLVNLRAPYEAPTSQLGDTLLRHVSPPVDQKAESQHAESSLVEHLQQQIRHLNEELKKQSGQLASAQAGQEIIRADWELSNTRQAMMLQGEKNIAIRRHENALLRKFRRTEQRLSAEVGRLQAQVATQQTDKLNLSRRLEERTKDLASATSRLSEEKTKCQKLALEVESGERAIWRMASKLEVGTHSVLSKWSQTGVIAGLQKRLESMEQKVKDADKKVEKFRELEEKSKARISDAERLQDELRGQVTHAREEIKRTEMKWQLRVDKLEEENVAGRRALEKEQAEHEDTRRLLEEERKQAEEIQHKLSVCEVNIVKMQKRIEELEQTVKGGRLALEEANASRDEQVKKWEEKYEDCKARLSEAIAKNEIREDAFSRNWTASQWRTAMNAGERGDM